MLAHRVVLQRGLELEPEEWLASIDEETYRYWEAYYNCEPWGSEQALLAKVINQLSLLVAFKIGGENGQDFVIQTQDLLHSEWVGRQKAVDDSISAAQRKLEGGNT